MRRIQPIRSTGAAAAVGVTLGALVLSGCGAGQVTQTSTQVSAVDGASSNAGPIAVRNAQFVLGSGVEGAAAFARGGDAPVQMTIVNTGTTADTLVSASSPVASDVQIEGTRDIQAGRTLNVEGAPGGSSVEPAGVAAAASASASATSTPAPTSGAAPTSGPATTSAAAAPSATAGATPAATASAATTPLPTAAPGSTTASIVLTGLREDIRSGQTYGVTLTFRSGGQVTIPVPVSVSSEPRKVDTAE